MPGTPRCRTCRRFKAKPENTDVYGRKLGSFQMDPAAGHQVELAADPDESVAADAIYVVATPAPGPAAVFTWLPTVPASGAYKIYANWPADASRPTDAVFNVIHAGGTTPIVVNQRQNGGQWHLLGTYTLDPGQNHGVDLESSTTGMVAADAIRIVADSAAPQNVAYVHADHLATPQKMTDPSGTVVWDRDALPFGQTASLTGTGELPLRFPGQFYDDETGLYYNYFRDYDPSTGRYIQSDPIGLEGGLNTYAYVGGNPINATDPFGLVCVSVGGRTTCITPSTAVAFPTPVSWPRRLGPNNPLYHRYSIPVSGPGDIDCILQGIINDPTPGADSPATADGTENNASPSGIPISSPVNSYLTNDLRTGAPVVVNVTKRGHPLHPGYVARSVTASGGGVMISNVGEGAGFLQSSYSPFSGMINNVWRGQSSDILDSGGNSGQCKCQ